MFIVAEKNGSVYISFYRKSQRFKRSLIIHKKNDQWKKNNHKREEILNMKKKQIWKLTAESVFNIYNTLNFYW